MAGVTNAEACRRYRESEKGKARDTRYRTSPARKAVLELRAKERRVMGWVKLSEGCVDCGYKKNPGALHWDHIEGNKKFNLHESWSWDARLDEMSKCVVRCANCHSERHHPWPR